jgi:uncharacterized low-complexity protein
MKASHKSLHIALGTTLLSGLGVTAVFADTPNVSAADTSLFEIAELSEGYMQLAEAKETTMKKKEGACGEGKCGGDKKAGDKEGSMEKTKEGKCGEGKCGDKK